MVTELVTLYKKNTNTYPTRVMYLRDGVAEGQFSKVREFEVSAIKNAVQTLSGKVPAVTAIVVRKRNHTRLFPRDREGDRGSRGNVHPGTVVDQDITHPRDFDFCILQLLSTPTNGRSCSAFEYSRNCSSRSLLHPLHPPCCTLLISDVIYDDNKCTADFIQKICYQMSYVYQRSSGAVSLRTPPPLPRPS